MSRGLVSTNQTFFASETRFAIFNLEQSSFSVYMTPEWKFVPERKFHSDWKPKWTYSRMNGTGTKFRLGVMWTDPKKYVKIEWTRCRMKAVSCKQTLEYVDWWIFIHLLIKNRRQEVLYTRLPLMDNTRRSRRYLQDVPSEFIVTDCEAFKALAAGKIHKAIGPVFIPNRILKEFAQELAPVVRDIYISSLIEGYFPNALKASLLNLIPKISPPQRIESDLRPIALTGTLAKVL